MEELRLFILDEKQYKTSFKKIFIYKYIYIYIDMKLFV